MSTRSQESDTQSCKLCHTGSVRTGECRLNAFFLVCVFCLTQLPGSAAWSLNVGLKPGVTLWRLQLLLWEYLLSHCEPGIIPGINLGCQRFWPGK